MGRKGKGGGRERESKGSEGRGEEERERGRVAPWVLGGYAPALVRKYFLCFFVDK